MKILVINGANLNLLGKRNPEIYGSFTLLELESKIKNLADELNIEIEFEQTNSESTIIDLIHFANNNFDGIILNAGAYTHTSIAIRDAIEAIEKPVIEVHISNIFAREEFRHHSYLSAVSVGIISGFGVNSYLLALRALNDIINAHQ